MKGPAFSKRAASSRKRQRGQTLVEFGLVSVVFFLFLFGVFDMARLIQSWITVQHAARESARYAITGLTNCEGASGRDNCIRWVGRNATTGIFGGGGDGSDVHVTYEAWDYQGNYWSGPIDNTTGKSCDQIEVTVSYTHTFATPFLQALLPSGVDLKGIQRMTNEPYGACEAGDGTGPVSGGDSGGSGEDDNDGAGSNPTPTPVPPTPAPPTSTPVPPTATPAPTSTPVPTPTSEPSCQWWDWRCE